MPTNIHVSLVTHQMILPVVKYGSPVLRQKGARIEAITPEIKKLIADMFETMEENHGVGLAAQQIGVAKQLTVIDVREVKDRPSWLELKGFEAPHQGQARRPQGRELLWLHVCPPTSYLSGKRQRSWLGIDDEATLHG